MTAKEALSEEMGWAEDGIMDTIMNPIKKATGAIGNKMVNWSQKVPSAGSAKTPEQELEEHDKKSHPGGYKGGKCTVRGRLAQQGFDVRGYDTKVNKFTAEEGYDYNENSDEEKKEPEGEEEVAETEKVLPKPETVEVDGDKITTNTELGKGALESIQEALKDPNLSDEQREAIQQVVDKLKKDLQSVQQQADQQSQAQEQLEQHEQAIEQGRELNEQVSSEEGQLDLLSKNHEQAVAEIAQQIKELNGKEPETTDLKNELVKENKKFEKEFQKVDPVEQKEDGTQETPEEHAKHCKAHPKSNCPFLKGTMTPEQLKEVDAQSALEEKSSDADKEVPEEFSYLAGPITDEQYEEYKKAPQVQEFKKQCEEYLAQGGDFDLTDQKQFPKGGLNERIVNEVLEERKAAGQKVVEYTDEEIEDVNIDEPSEDDKWKEKVEQYAEGMRQQDLSKFTPGQRAALEAFSQQIGQTIENILSTTKGREEQFADLLDTISRFEEVKRRFEKTQNASEGRQGSREAITEAMKEHVADSYHSQVIEDIDDILGLSREELDPAVKDSLTSIKDTLIETQKALAVTEAPAIRAKVVARRQKALDQYLKLKAKYGLDDLIGNETEKDYGTKTEYSPEKLKIFNEHYTGKLAGTDLLNPPSSQEKSTTELTETADILSKVMASEKLNMPLGDLKATKMGPSQGVLTFEVPVGFDITKANKTATLQKLGLAIGGTVNSIEQGNEPNTVNITYSSKNPRTVNLADVVSSKEWKDNASSMAIPNAIGIDSEGNSVVKDAAKGPHEVVTGATGTGKSVYLQNKILAPKLVKTPNEWKHVLIDPKQQEFTGETKSPYNWCPVQFSAQGAATALARLVQEMKDRASTLGINLDEYNEMTGEGPNQDDTSKNLQSYNEKNKGKELPFISLVIDEVQDLIQDKDFGKDITQNLAQLLAKARSVGINVTVATQSDRVENLPGILRTNLPTKTEFPASASDTKGSFASKALKNAGDFIQTDKQGKKITGRACFVQDDEIKRVHDFYQKQGGGTLEGTAPGNESTAPTTSPDQIIDGLAKTDKGKATLKAIADRVANGDMKSVRGDEQSMDKVKKLLDGMGYGYTEMKGADGKVTITPKPKEQSNGRGFLQDAAQKHDELPNDKIHKFDAANRWLRQGDSGWGSVEAEPGVTAAFKNAANHGGADIPAHGFGKDSTLQGGLNRLFTLLKDGVDANRGGGKLFHTALSGNDSSSGTAGGAYKDGPLMLLGSKGSSFTGKLENLKAVLVNDFAKELIPDIQEAISKIRPDIKVFPYSEADKAAQFISSQRETNSTKANPNTPSVGGASPDGTNGAKAPETGAGGTAEADSKGNANAERNSIDESLRDEYDAYHKDFEETVAKARKNLAAKKASGKARAVDYEDAHSQETVAIETFNNWRERNGLPRITGINKDGSYTMEPAQGAEEPTGEKNASDDTPADSATKKEPALSRKDYEAKYPQNRVGQLQRLNDEREEALDAKWQELSDKGLSPAQIKQDKGYKALIKSFEDEETQIKERFPEEENTKKDKDNKNDTKSDFITPKDDISKLNKYQKAAYEAALKKYNQGMSSLEEQLTNGDLKYKDFTSKASDLLKELNSDRSYLGFSRPIKEDGTFSSKNDILGLKIPESATEEQKSTLEEVLNNEEITKKIGENVEPIDVSIGEKGEMYVTCRGERNGEIKESRIILSKDGNTMDLVPIEEQDKLEKVPEKVDKKSTKDLSETPAETATPQNATTIPEVDAPEDEPTTREDDANAGEEGNDNMQEIEIPQAQGRTLRGRKAQGEILKKAANENLKEQTGEIVKPTAFASRNDEDDEPPQAGGRENLPPDDGGDNDDKSSSEGGNNNPMPPKTTPTGGEKLYPVDEESKTLTNEEVNARVDSDDNIKALQKNVDNAKTKSAKDKAQRQLNNAKKRLAEAIRKAATPESGVIVQPELPLGDGETSKTIPKGGDDSVNKKKEEASNANTQQKFDTPSDALTRGTEKFSPEIRKAMVSDKTLQNLQANLVKAQAEHGNDSKEAKTAARTLETAQKRFAEAQRLSKTPESGVVDVRTNRNNPNKTLATAPKKEEATPQPPKTETKAKPLEKTPATAPTKATESQKQEKEASKETQGNAENTSASAAENTTGKTQEEEGSPELLKAMEEDSQVKDFQEQVNKAKEMFGENSREHKRAIEQLKKVKRDAKINKAAEAYEAQMHPEKVKAKDRRPTLQSSIRLADELLTSIERRDADALKRKVATWAQVGAGGKINYPDDGGSRAAFEMLTGLKLPVPDKAKGDFKKTNEKDNDSQAYVQQVRKFIDDFCKTKPKTVTPSPSNPTGNQPQQGTKGKSQTGKKPTQATRKSQEVKQEESQGSKEPVKNAENPFDKKAALTGGTHADLSSQGEAARQRAKENADTSNSKGMKTLAALVPPKKIDRSTAQELNAQLADISSEMQQLEKSLNEDNLSKKERTQRLGLIENLRQGLQDVYKKNRLGQGNFTFTPQMQDGHLVGLSIRDFKGENGEMESIKEPPKTKFSEMSRDEKVSAVRKIIEQESMHQAGKGVSSESTAAANRLVDAVMKKDADTLAEELRISNPGARKAFEEMTGTSLPDSIKGTLEAIDKHCGITPEKRDEITEKKKQEKQEAEANAQKEKAKEEAVKKAAEARKQKSEDDAFQKTFKDKNANKFYNEKQRKQSLPQLMKKGWRFEIEPDGKIGFWNKDGEGYYFDKEMQAEIPNFQKFVAGAIRYGKNLDNGTVTIDEALFADIGEENPGATVWDEIFDAALVSMGYGGSDN